MTNNFLPSPYLLVLMLKILTLYDLNPIIFMLCIYTKFLIRYIFQQIHFLIQHT